MTHLMIVLIILTWIGRREEGLISPFCLPRHCHIRLAYPLALLFDGLMPPIVQLPYLIHFPLSHRLNNPSLNPFVPSYIQKSIKICSSRSQGRGTLRSTVLRLLFSSQRNKKLN